MEDDDAPKKKPAHEIGQDLTLLSVLRRLTSKNTDSVSELSERNFDDVGHR